MTVRNRSAWGPLALAALVLAAGLLVLQPMPAQALDSGLITGTGGTSGGGGSGGSGSIEYYDFEPDYDAMKSWTLGGSRASGETAGKSNHHTNGVTADGPFIIRGDKNAVMDHWNVYVAYPTSADVAGDGSSATTMKWASYRVGNHGNTLQARNRHGTSPRSIRSTYWWMSAWHFYWAGQWDGAGNPIDQQNGAFVPNKEDNVAAASRDPHSSGKRNILSRTVATGTWLNRLGGSLSSAKYGDSDYTKRSYIHYFNNDNVILGAGDNGPGGNPWMQFRMAKVSNQLWLNEGRWALYIYRLGLREQRQAALGPETNGGYFDVVRRPRVRVKVVDEAGNAVAGATAVLALDRSYAGMSDPDLPDDYGHVNVSASFPADGRTIGERANHQAYTTGARTISAGSMLNEALPVASWHRTSDGSQVGDHGYYLDVNLPAGYIYEDVLGDVKVYRSRYTNDAGTAESGSTLMYSNGEPAVASAAVDAVAYFGSRSANGGQTMTARGGIPSGMSAYAGFALGKNKNASNVDGGGIYTVVVRVLTPRPRGTVTTWGRYDATGDHAVGSDHAFANTAVSPTVMLSGPFNNPAVPPVYNFAVGINAPKLLDIGDYTLAATAASDAWKLSYVAKGSSVIPQAVRLGGTWCSMTGTLSSGTFNSAGAPGPYYGDQGFISPAANSQFIHVAVGSSQAVNIGIAHYVAPPMPTLPSTVIGGPSSWLDSGKPTSFPAEDSDYLNNDTIAGHWLRQPILGILGSPTAGPNWAETRKDAGVAGLGPVPYTFGLRWRAGTTVDLGIPSQSWRVANANRDGGFPGKYEFTMPGGISYRFSTSDVPLKNELGATLPGGVYADEAAARNKAVVERPVFGNAGTALGDWNAGSTKGVNYYAAVLYRVTIWVEVVNLDGTVVDPTPTYVYYQWGPPTFKNVKVYTTTGSF